MTESVLEREIAHEQRHVDLVYARIAAMEEQADLLAADGLARGRIDDASHVTWDHHRRLFERDALVNHAARRRATINSEYGGLVFGRMDRATGEAAYVGRLGVLDEDYEPLVMDWRAPAAAVYYRATAVDPMGLIRRRTLQCLDRTVTGVEDDLLDPDAAPEDLVVIGDGALMGALARARDHTMRDIVATIQAEQDAAIRAPARGATLITGGPGTGKTVVALHRVAYLLYSDRRRFEGGGVLVIGPSAGFMRYIERVLPSLGERSVQLRSLGEVLDGVEATGHDDPAAAAIKGSQRMVTVLRRAARDADPTAPTDFRMFHNGALLRLDSAALDRVRHRVLTQGAPRNRARKAVTRALVSALSRQVDGRAEAADTIADRNEFTDFVEDWWRPVTPAQVLEWLGDPGRLRRYANGILSRAEIETLAGSWGADRSIEDVAILDELRVLLGESPAAAGDRDEPRLMAERRYGGRESALSAPHYDEFAHLVVDEAQDLSPMQWRMLGRRARYAGWTVVGDAAQSSWPEPQEALAARTAAIGQQPHHTFHLGTNYRNSAEIFAFAGAYVRRTVPDADLPAAVRRTGQEPDHRIVAGDRIRAEVEAAVADLLRQVEGTVGVVTSEPFEIRSERVSVVDPLGCKGLEYDAVVVAEPDRIAAGAAGPRILYVALTRATQRLVTVGTTAAWREEADALAAAAR